MSRIPNRLSGNAHQMIIDPLVTGLIAMRMGRGTSEHYHNLATAMMIASHVCEIVHRHNHLQAELKPAFESLNVIFNRRKQRTIEDVPWSGTPEELDDIEHGVEILKAILKTTPGPVMARAVARATKETEEAVCA